MPFVDVMTNLTANQLPNNFMPNLIEKLVAIFGGPLTKDWFNWTLQTDQIMSKVRENILVITRLSKQTAYTLTIFIYKRNHSACFQRIEREISYRSRTIIWD